MGRPARRWVVGGIYHVMSRGSNRQSVVVDDGDFVDLERILLGALEGERVEAHAWVAMPNHWHGLFRCPPGGLSRLVQRVNHAYALRFDRRWERVGHVWQNRFKAVPQETDVQYLWALRYIARNPVEARLCAAPEDWRWGSFGPTAGLRPAPQALCVDEVLARFGHARTEAVARYVDFVTRT